MSVSGAFQIVSNVYKTATPSKINFSKLGDDRTLQMQAEAVHQLGKRLHRTLFLAWDSPCLSHRHYSYSTSTSHLLSDLLLSSPGRGSTTNRSANTWLRGRNLLGSPWSAFFYRELKVDGSGVSYWENSRFKTAYYLYIRKSWFFFFFVLFVICDFW